MTYQERDKSVSQGEPVEFFKFVSAYGEYRYTTDSQPGTCDGEIYLPVKGGIDRSMIEVTADLTANITVNFTMPANLELARKYCFRQSPDILRVEVRRAHRGDDWNTEFSVEWIGYGLSTSVSGDEATIETGSVLQAKMSGNVASIYYQRSCNHVLFDERCKVDRAAWTVTATVVEVQSQLITVDNDQAGDDELIAGEFVNTRTGEKRGIYANTNNVVSVTYPLVDLLPGDTVELTFGCDHLRLGHCKFRFDNVVNYGGFDFIPLLNPFTDLHFDSYITETIKQEYFNIISPENVNR